MNIDQIIAKMFSGKATQEELEALNVWKNEAQENIKAIKEMAAIDSAFEEIDSYKDYNVDAAWESMQSIMADKSPGERSSDTQTQSHEAKVVKAPWLRNVAAALILGLIAVAGFAWMQNGEALSSQPIVMESTNTILKEKLSDGTVVSLDKVTTLTQLSERAVGLQGRAYFDVAKSDKDQFTISTHTGSITVLGTQFVVDTRNEGVQIYVTEGTVRYDHKNRHVVLERGDKLTMADGDIVKVKATNEDLLAWLPQKLSFKDESLTTVVEAISAHYGQKIIVDNPKAVAKCKVNTSFQEEETIDEVLNELSLILGLKYHRKDGVLHIVASNC